MSELRWILICFGAIVLIAIYVWGRRASRRPAAPSGERFVIKPQAPLAGRNDDPLIATEGAHVDAFDPVVGAIDDPAGLPSWTSPAAAAPAPEPAPREVRRGRVEPTLGDAEEVPPDIEQRALRHDVVDADDESMLTVELPARETTDAPTLSMSNTPPPRRIERRKIISLRLAASPRYSGEQLRQAFEAESLEHGKYDVFHRRHEGAIVFSAASMVEPGTFDLERMDTLSYPGVTLFAQLPGPLPGVQALHDLVACGKQLQQALGGTLQDERGVPLTVHRIDRLRQEIAEFERGQGRETRNSSPA